jgi:outer membrane protein assembly factor BamB
MRLITLLTLSASMLAAENWPEWRGPNSNGTAKGDVPLEFSDTKNVAWKATIPGRGHSSPVIFGNKIFITTAVTTDGQESAARVSLAPDSRGIGGAGFGKEYHFVLMCLDTKSGKVLWQRTAKTAKPHEGYHPKYGSFASNSPVTDGKFVFAFFGSRGVFAYDLDGNLKWQKDVPPMKMRLSFGEGTAPVLHENYLILNNDQEQGSYVSVLDKTTGEQIWRADREESSSWAAPLVVEHNKAKQLIISATNKVRSYDLKTGKVIWECTGLGANVIPAPVVQKDVVYVMSGFRNPNLLAIKLGGTGDLTGSKNILWTNQRGNSYTPSPVLLDNKLYFISDTGMLTCLNATTGEAYYQQQRLPKPYNFKASPVLVNGKIYLATEEGDVVVVKAGEKFEVLATNTMSDQVFIASPAVVDGAMYLRGQNTLFCIK